MNPAHHDRAARHFDREFVGRRTVVASVSGGKDSAAMCLYLRELGIEPVRVFADTGWEHPSTYEYLRGELTRALGPIHEVRAERWSNGIVDGDDGFVQLVRRKGMFPTRTRRFCTVELKVKPLAAFVRDLDDDIVNAVGIRADESASRAKMAPTEWSNDFDCEVWRPILRWRHEDVVEIHRRHGLRLNPLYERGAERVGCWPCIHARKAEIAMLAEVDPARIAKIRALEAEVQAAAEARHESRGETIESAGHQRPTFFQGPLGETCDLCRGSGDEVPCTGDHAAHKLLAKGSAPPAACDRVPCQRCGGRGKRRTMWPIDRVIDWSRTARGGYQRELFSAGVTGWVSAGLCEAAPEDGTDG